MISRGNVFPIQGGSWRDGKRKVRKALRGGDSWRDIAPAPLVSYAATLA